MSTDGTASSEHGPDADALEMSVDISILEAQQADYEKIAPMHYPVWFEAADGTPA